MEQTKNDVEHVQKVQHYTVPDRTRGGVKVNIIILQAKNTK